MFSVLPLPKDFLRLLFTLYHLQIKSSSIHLLQSKSNNFYQIGVIPVDNTGQGLEGYKYYSTQRPIDIGTFPKPADNPPTAILNYDCDRRVPVEGGAFPAWGELIYDKPLTDGQRYDYELRPSRENPDVREKMYAQAQTVGAWELYRRIPEEKRVTVWDCASAVFFPLNCVTPERLNAQYNTAQKFPVPKKHPGRQKTKPQRESR